MEFPNKKYKVIYADPPWSYNDTQKSGGTAYFGACVRYPTMNNEDIYTLPVEDIAQKNSLLFLWVTSPLLEEGMQTIKEWGFNYTTIAFYWSKYTKNYKLVSNMGRWTMGNIELCLLGKRGRPKRIKKNVKQLVQTRRREHSRKPDEVKKRIEKLMGDVSRIELFARETTKGWDAWGNEVGKFDNEFEGQKEVKQRALF